MSACAVMLVKDEADVIEATLRHLAEQVDHIIVSDNVSTDGTTEILQRLRWEGGLPLTIGVDDVVGYYQSEKTTDLARRAYDMGYGWVVPCDADEIWYANGRTVASLLDGQTPDVQIVTAELFNHLPTAEDDPDIQIPQQRIGWRKREPGALPKVAARTRPDLRIGMGNHSATTDGTALAVPGLVIRHFSWRTGPQYLRKIRNGEAAYAAAPEKADYGQHWKMWEGKPDEAVVEHFYRWFYSALPRDDDSLIYDPSPLAGVV